MGITGLLPFIRNSCRPVNIRDFKGAVVAIDAYSWLHKGAFSCAEKLVKGEKTDGYVHYCMKQLNMLLDCGVKPIMVFDGCNLESKAGTEKKRQENRERTRQKGKEFLCQGKVKEARECFQRCVDVTPEMAFEVIQACRAKGIDYIVAPYEADAQLAYLNISNMCQIVITEDSDLVLFGCEKILFKMDSCGGGVLYEKENLPKSFGSQAEKMSFEKFRYMCILSGCDYLPSLPGIGLAKACKFFGLTTNPDLRVVLLKLPSYLKMPKLVVSSEYIEDFLKANNTFLYQLVYCPKKKALVPLQPYPESTDISDMEYAGKYIPDELAVQIASGDINVKTLKKFERFNQTQNTGASGGTISRGGSSLLSKPNSKSSAQEAKSYFQFKQRSSESVPAQSVKKRSHTETSDGYDVEDERNQLFSVYSSESKRPKKDDDDDDDFEVVSSSSSPRSRPSREQNDVCEEISPMRKALAKKLAISQNKDISVPLQKVVRSRFFVSGTKRNASIEPVNSEKPDNQKVEANIPKSATKLGLMDSIDEEYGMTANEVSSPEDSPLTNDKLDSSSKSISVNNNSDLDKSDIRYSPLLPDNKENLSRESAFNFKNSSKLKLGRNLSLGSCGSSLNESYGSQSDDEEASDDAKSQLDCLNMLPFRSVRRNSPSSPRKPLSSLECEDVLTFDLEDSPVKVINETSQLPSLVKDKTGLLQLEERLMPGSQSDKKNSGKQGCRSTGLSRNKPKSVRQLNMQDTLFNFRFTRMTKNNGVPS